MIGSDGRAVEKDLFDTFGTDRRGQNIFVGFQMAEQGLLKYGLTWVKKMAAAQWLGTLKLLSHMITEKSI